MKNIKNIQIIFDYLLLLLFQNKNKNNTRYIQRLNHPFRKLIFFIN